MLTSCTLAAGLGFEPRYSPPKGDVLPLDDPAIIYKFYNFIALKSMFQNKENRCNRLAENILRYIATVY